MPDKETLLSNKLKYIKIVEEKIKFKERILSNYY
jgi:hypothetical protein